jgi:hypothetical protein
MEVVMKAMAIAAVFAFAAGAACAQPATRPANTCLNVRDIDHTHAADANTLLFYMRNGTVWQNKLATPCLGLTTHGFAFTVRDIDEVCSNAQGITVIQTNEVCQLGPFTPVAGAAGGHASP